MDALLSLQKRIETPSTGQTLSVEDSLWFALQEAYKGAGYTSPNPLVGCVVLDKDNQFLSSGYHARLGEGHAEINALSELAKTPDILRDATVIVTLEPCAHEGRTGSCAKFLATLPIKKVVFGMVDPNPQVAGQGAQILKNAGKVVECFLEKNPDKSELNRCLKEVCEPFLYNQKNKKIFTALKIATSLDGQVALSSGESQWITGPEARESAHYLRAFYDGLIVGKNTVLVDNPSLNIRHPQFVEKKNKIIILDSQAETLARPDLDVFQRHDPQNIFVCVSEGADIPQTSVKVLKVARAEIGLDLNSVMSALWKEGLRSCLVEGGGIISSEFLKQKLVQRLYMYQAPLIIGKGQSWSRNIEIQSLSEALKIDQLKYRSVGADLLLSGVVG